MNLIKIQTNINYRSAKIIKHHSLHQVINQFFIPNPFYQSSDHNGFHTSVQSLYTPPFHIGYLNLRQIAVKESSGLGNCCVMIFRLHGCSNVNASSRKIMSMNWRLKRMELRNSSLKKMKPTNLQELEPHSRLVPAPILSSGQCNLEESIQGFRGSAQVSPHEREARQVATCFELEES